jgi:Flp pilus assembly protein TadD
MMLEGELSESRGDFLTAAKVYKRRLDEDPSDFSSAVSLSRVRLRMKDFKAAIREADIAIGIDDGDWEPHWIKAQAYSALGDSHRSQAENAQVSARLAIVGMRLEDLEAKGAA